MEERMLPGIDTKPLEGYEIVAQVVAVILNREETTPEQINAYLQSVGAETLYDAYVGPAVDRCEEAIQAFSRGEA